jgi:hypothetical protein
MRALIILTILSLVVSFAASSINTPDLGRTYFVTHSLRSEVYQDTTKNNTGNADKLQKRDIGDTTSVQPERKKDTTIPPPPPVDTMPTIKTPNIK